ncbi:MAG: hypothetical protein ACP5N1_04490 [Candidatus Woesearchaeota archaeon]
MAILSLEAITSSESVDELLLKYRKAGIKTANSLDQQTLQIIESDWEHHKKEHYTKAKAGEISDEPKVQKISVDGVNYTIVGFTHNKQFISSKYHEKLASMHRYPITPGENAPITICENNLENFFAPHPILSINDHSMLKYGDMFILGIMFPVYLTPIGIKYLHNLINTRTNKRKSDLRTYIDSTFDYPRPPVVILEEWNKYQNFSESGTLKFTRCQKRSAYMAEFAKNYRNKRNKIIFCGDSHRSEIAYFLKHGVNNKDIQEKAKYNADLAMHDYSRYNNQYIAKGTYSQLKFIAGGLITLAASIKLGIEAINLVERLF